MFKNLFNDEGRIYDKWEPDKLYIPQKLLALFLTCIGEFLVFAGLIGGLIGLQIASNIIGSQIILIIPGIILLLVGMAGVFVLPYTIYYMVMWWLTRDSYYINMYNEKT